MGFDFIDLALLVIIFSIVGYYAYLRYREEKRKKEKQLIPTLKYYHEKFSREKREFTEKAKKFRDKMEHFRNKLQQIENEIYRYKWEKDEKRYLRNLKGTDFEWTMSFLLKILGFKVYEPPVYKDHNIDFIVEIDGFKICVDFVDYQQLKKLNENYIRQLTEGKEKYKCCGIWIISNGNVEKKDGWDRQILFFDYRDILRFFPSIRVVEDYYEVQTKFHNYELLHKETSDEIIRRDTWIKEVEEKLKEAYRKKSMVAE
ncbi:restriction endonuclease [Persephonella sp.]